MRNIMITKWIMKTTRILILNTVYLPKAIRIVNTLISILVRTSIERLIGIETSIKGRTCFRVLLGFDK